MASGTEPKPFNSIIDIDTGITDANQAMNGADYFRVVTVSASTLNIPTASPGVLFHIGSSQSYGAQFLVYTGNKTIHRRHLSGGTWGNWETL